MSDSPDRGARVVAFVGSYADAEHGGGGVHAFDITGEGARLVPLGHVDLPEEAGYLVYRASSRTLYAVDERKTDGRGPVRAPAAVHSFTVGPKGQLAPLNSRRAFGPFPTYLAIAEDPALLIAVSHGSFDHVERVVPDAEHGWRTEYIYDDSTVVVHPLASDGTLGAPSDVQVLDGHGVDPNGSPQAGGHGQASPHAHCGVIDPSGEFLLVADKGTDSIHIFKLGRTLQLVSIFHARAETGPRHLVFHPTRSRVFATYEFSSEVVSLDFDTESGTLTQLDAVSTVFADPGRVNEPADIRIHPSGGVLYVNNRGEDSIAWFTAMEDGTLTRRGHVELAHSIHPGLAARSISVDPQGRYLLVADRPANLVRSYAISPDDHSSLEFIGEISVPNPAFVLVAVIGDEPTSDEPKESR